MSSILKIQNPETNCCIIELVRSVGEILTHNEVCHPDMLTLQTVEMRELLTLALPVLEKSIAWCATKIDH